MSTGTLPWFVARAGGLVSWYLLAASVIWGLLLSSKMLGRIGNRRWLLDLHRFLGGLSVIFVGVHLTGILFDTYVDFGLREVLVPFAATWRPGAVAWGIVAFYLLVAVEVSSLLMRHIRRKWWHRIHLSSLLLLVLATVHGFTAGTDRSNAGARWVALIVASALIFIATFRVLAERKAQRADRSAAIAAARARLSTEPPESVASSAEEGVLPSSSTRS